MGSMANSIQHAVVNKKTVVGRVFHLIRYHKWNIIFTSFTAFAIYSDYSRTQNWKLEISKYKQNGLISHFNLTKRFGFEVILVPILAMLVANKLEIHEVEGSMKYCGNSRLYGRPLKEGERHHWPRYNFMTYCTFKLEK